MPIKMGRLLESQPTKIKRYFYIDNIRCGILSRFVVALTRFERTHNIKPI